MKINDSLRPLSTPTNTHRWAQEQRYGFDIVKNPETAERWKNLVHDWHEFINSKNDVANQKLIWGVGPRYHVVQQFHLQD